jgi:hypothetical protein
MLMDVTVAEANAKVHLASENMKAPISKTARTS